MIQPDGLIPHAHKCPTCRLLARCYAIHCTVTGPLLCAYCVAVSFALDGVVPKAIPSAHQWMCSYHDCELRGQPHEHLSE